LAQAEITWRDEQNSRKQRFEIGAVGRGDREKVISGDEPGLYNKD